MSVGLKSERGAERIVKAMAAMIEHAGFGPVDETKIEKLPSMFAASVFFTLPDGYNIARFSFADSDMERPLKIAIAMKKAGIPVFGYWDAEKETRTLYYVQQGKSSSDMLGIHVIPVYTHTDFAKEAISRLKALGAVILEIEKTHFTYYGKSSRNEAGAFVIPAL